jgi:hypothetical protein
MSGPALTGGFRQLLEVNVRTLSNGPKCISKFAPHLIARRENKRLRMRDFGPQG